MEKLVKNLGNEFRAMNYLNEHCLKLQKVE